MTTTGSAARRVSRGDHARPAANPLVIVSDRSRLLMVIVLVSWALTIALTRLLLALTSYPQLGNSTFHIGHALWDGLFLLAAGITALVVGNWGAALVVAPGPGRDYYRKKLAQSKMPKEARRALKRRRSDTVYRRLANDHDTSILTAA